MTDVTNELLSDQRTYDDVKTILRDYWALPAVEGAHCTDCAHGTTEDYVAARRPDLRAALDNSHFTFLVNEAERTVLASL